MPGRDQDIKGGPFAPGRVWPNIRDSDKSAGLRDRERANRERQEKERERQQAAGGFKKWASNGGSSRYQGNRRSRSPARATSSGNRYGSREYGRGRSRSHKPSKKTRKSKDSSLSSTSSSVKRQRKQTDKARNILMDQSTGYRKYKKEQKLKEEEEYRATYTSDVAQQVLKELEPLKALMDQTAKQLDFDDDEENKAKAKGKGKARTRLPISIDDKTEDEDTLTPTQVKLLKTIFRNKMDFDDKLTKGDAIKHIKNKLEKAPDTKWFKEVIAEFWNANDDLTKPNTRKEQARMIVERVIGDN